MVFELELSRGSQERIELITCRDRARVVEITAIDNWDTRVVPRILEDSRRTDDRKPGADEDRCAEPHRALPQHRLQIARRFQSTLDGQVAHHEPLAGIGAGAVQE